MSRGRRLSAALALLLLRLPPLSAAEPERRGPFEAREGYLLAQRRLALAPLAPDPLPRGDWQLRIDLDWGNDFARRLRGYMIDGEHRALVLTVRGGVTGSFTLGARLPLLWRGGGSLDGVADWIHGLGFPDNGRPFVPRDRLVVDGPLLSGERLAWGGSSGTGLGKLELEARLAPGSAARRGFAAVGRVAFPTGIGEFRGGGFEAGVQALAAFPLGARWDGYAGLGVAFSGETKSEGLEYRQARPFGHLGLEWRFARRWSAIAQVDGGGRLVTNLDRYPGLQTYFRLGLKVDVGRQSRIDVAFTENIKSQQATTDFGVYLGVARRF
jgi:hypothetical protein